MNFRLRMSGNGVKKTCTHMNQSKSANNMATNAINQSQSIPSQAINQSKSSQNMTSKDYLQCPEQEKRIQPSCSGQLNNINPLEKRVLSVGSLGSTVPAHSVPSPILIGQNHWISKRIYLRPQHRGQSVSQQISRSVNLSVSQVLSKSVNQSVSKSVSQSVVSELISELVSKSVS